MVGLQARRSRGKDREPDMVSVLTATEAMRAFRRASGEMHGSDARTVATSVLESLSVPQKAIDAILRELDGDRNADAPVGSPALNEAFERAVAWHTAMPTAKSEA